MQRSCADVNSPYKRKYWYGTELTQGVPLVNSLGTLRSLNMHFGWANMDSGEPEIEWKKWRAGCNFCHCLRLPTETVHLYSIYGTTLMEVSEYTWVLLYIKNFTFQKLFWVQVRHGSESEFFWLDQIPILCLLDLYRYNFSSRFVVEVSLYCWPHT